MSAAAGNPAPDAGEIEGLRDGRIGHDTSLSGRRRDADDHRRAEGTRH
jgi:hypothetical protein